MRLIMKPGQDHPVFGKMVHAGEEFEVPDLEAPVWLHSGRAIAAPQRNHSVATKVLKAAVEESNIEEKQDKKRYSRRDMRPEE